MRQSLIAVCLVFLTPTSVMACYEHDAGAGWVNEEPSMWSHYGIGAQAAQRDRLLDMSVFAGGLGVLILLGVGMRNLVRAARRAAVETVEPSSRAPLALPNDGPPCEPLCVLAGFDGQDDGWASLTCDETVNESCTGATFPVASFHSLV